MNTLYHQLVITASFASRATGHSDIDRTNGYQMTAYKSVAWRLFGVKAEEFHTDVNDYLQHSKLPSEKLSLTAITTLINNGGKLHLEQAKEDGIISVQHFFPKQGELLAETIYTIPPEDFVMLLNYYTFCQRNDLDIFYDETDHYVTADELGNAWEVVLPQSDAQGHQPDKENEIFFSVSMQDGSRKNGWIAVHETLQRYIRQLYSNRPNQYNAYMHFIEWSDRINCVVNAEGCIINRHFFMTKEEFGIFMERVKPATEAGQCSGRRHMLREIQITWSIEDVQEKRNDLSEEQCAAVLEWMRDHHDAGIGINWTSLRRRRMISIQNLDNCKEKYIRRNDCATGLQSHLPDPLSLLHQAPNRSGQRMRSSNPMPKRMHTQ